MYVIAGVTVVAPRNTKHGSSANRALGQKALLHKFPAGSRPALVTDGVLSTDPASQYCVATAPLDPATDHPDTPYVEVSLGGLFAVTHVAVTAPEGGESTTFFTRVFAILYMVVAIRGGAC